ncbi:MAG: transglycosylase SLT domain-containing protein [Anaerolineae bacterium]|nr:transglycosylase SLT domain-containing protein [Anaerolineae bacterium]
MSEREGSEEMRRRSGPRAPVLIGHVAGILLLALLLVWVNRDHLRSPQALYREAQSAEPRRAARLYQRLGEALPQIEEYAQLWAAEAAMPGLEAVRTLQAILAFRPDSPAAYRAHIALARHYARIGASRAEEEYRAALAMEDSHALRLELANYLEAQGEDEGAYAEYHDLLSEQQDAFAGMRRTGPDPLATARDLIAATYYSDALETLRGIDDPEAVPLRAQALAGLGRYEEAERTYRTWLEEEPEDTTAQLGLARSVMRLGRAEEALSLYEAVDHGDAVLARAELLEAEDPEQALALYIECPYPVAWWSATAMLEAQGRLTETLPLYARLGRSQTYLADDAAYRLYVLSQRTGDRGSEAEAMALLDGLGLNWFALRAAGGELDLNAASPLGAAGDDILQKAGALSAIGREDLADMEIAFAARFQGAPETKLAMLEELVARGGVVEAQAIAQAWIGEGPRAPLALWRLSYPRPYADTVEAAAAEYDVDPLLIWAVMREESRYDPEALSYVGARGLMQVMPATQTWIAEQMGEELSPGDAYTPEASVRMGAWFLRFLTDHFDGDLELVIAAYNGGAGSVGIWLDDPLVRDRDDLLRWIGYGETREYLAKVSLSYRVYQTLYAEGGDGG